MEEEVDDLTKELEAEKDAHTATKEGLAEEAEAHKAAKADAESQLEALGKQTEALEKEVEAHTATKAELDAAKTSHEEAAAAASTELESVMEEVRKTHLLRHFVPTMIILPRQARDQHRKNSKRDAFFAGDG
jgi:DNA repair exonuclease SbcCD ATPase subunit